MPDELKAICPYWSASTLRTCEEARQLLREQGADCGFITKVTVSTPSMIVGAPPTNSQGEICIIKAIQGSLNSVHDGLGLIIQLLKMKSSPPTMPFGKG